MSDTRKAFFVPVVLVIPAESETEARDAAHEALEELLEKYRTGAPLADWGFSDCSRLQDVRTVQSIEISGEAEYEEGEAFAT